MWKYLRDILLTILIAIAVFLLLQVTVGAFRVYGTSMLPNLKQGDFILVEKVSYRFQPPKHGDVIVLRSPKNQNTDLIKRIIASPGDTIEIRNDQVYVNGKAIAEPYIKEPPKYSYPKEQVPADNYFVLGDNRNVSADSHAGWFLNKQDVVGKAWIIYWPLERFTVVKHYNF